MGIYFNPLLMLPFSTMETINDEKNEITARAAIEKYLKLFGSTADCATLKGRLLKLLVLLASLDTKLRIRIKRWYDNEKSRGAMNIIIAAMNIM